MSSKIVPSPEQARVIAAPPGHVVVVAGAGTGKTETLTGRVLQLLLEGAPGSNARPFEPPCELHQIVALTFTDKAAAEMRGRVYAGLVARLREETDTEKRARLERLRSEWGASNRIGTFDAFTRKILDAFPEAAYERANVPPGFETSSGSDERDLHVLLTRAFWDSCESLQNAQRDDLFELLSRFDRSLLTLLIAELARENADTLERLSQKIEVAEVRAQTELLCAEARARHERRSARTLQRLWQAAQNAVPDELSPQLSRVLRDEATMRGGEVLTAVAAWRRDFARRFAPEDLERAGIALPAFKRWRDEAKRHREERELLQVSDEAMAIEHESREIVRRLATLALNWKRARQRVSAQERKLDFEEISRAARAILEDSSFASRARGGCKWVLVDEFQDTNDAQWSLIDALNVPNVLVVGDEKQSIYGFRQGDITVFDRVRRQLLDQAPPFELSVSRRSAPAIVSWCNQVFAQLLPDENAREEFEAPFLALQPAPGDARTGCVHALRPLAPSSLNEEESERGRGARAVAVLLRALQDDADDGSFARLPALRSTAEKLRAGTGSVGVLFRTHERKAECEAALDELGVPYASVRGIGFWQSETARDALNLAAWLAESRDDLAMLGVLRSPFGALSDFAITSLRAHFSDVSLWDALCLAARELPPHFPVDEREVLQLAHRRLERWQLLARVRLMSDVFETARLESDAPFYEAGWPDALQREANWSKILDEMRAREETGRGGAREIALYFREQESFETREPDAPLPDVGAIQLMTVYAAKGLGFDLTLLAQTDDVPRAPTATLKRGAFPDRGTMQVACRIEGDGSFQERLLPPTWHVLELEERARESAEWLRLLYVACTRARDDLIVLMPQARRAGSWADLLMPFCEGLEPMRLEERKADECRL